MKNEIIQALQTLSRQKARQIAATLTAKTGQRVDKSAVNAVLYKLQNEGIAMVNEAYEWTLTHQNHLKAPDEETQTDQSSDTIEFVLTDAQAKLAADDKTERLLIRGQAGSGKTTILVQKMLNAIRSNPANRCLYLTYNSALKGHVQSLCSTSDTENAGIHSFHQYCKSVQEAIRATSLAWCDAGKKNSALAAIITGTEQRGVEFRLFNLDNDPELLKWWADEVGWIYGQGIFSLTQYVDAVRTGRGKRYSLARDEREHIWDIFEQFDDFLEENDLLDYDNPCGFMLSLIRNGSRDLLNDHRIDHCYVDEVQDFDKSWLMYLSEITTKTLTLAGDVSQKIYRRNFTWRSIFGTDFRGPNGARLEIPFRTTEQIMRVAIHVLQESSCSETDDFSQPRMPSKQGPRVKQLRAQNAVDAYNGGYNYISQMQKEWRGKNNVIVMPFNNQIYVAQKKLKELGVTAQAGKGEQVGLSASGSFVTTFHQTKGLEFDNVVVFGLNDAQFPGRHLKGIDVEDIPDEISTLSRLFYVVLTRAKHSVTLVTSTPTTRFLDNIPTELLDIVDI